MGKLQKVILIFCVAGVISGWSNPDSASHDSTPLILSDTLAEKSISVFTEEEQRKYNKRYQVGGAIAMMVFVGVLIGSVQTFNPK